MFQELGNAYCMLFGSNSVLIAFVAGVAVMIFFVVLALNEGNSMLTWGIKILIGVAGLVGAGALLQSIFGGKVSALNCAVDGAIVQPVVTVASSAVQSLSMLV